MMATIEQRATYLALTPIRLIKRMSETQLKDSLEMMCYVWMLALVGGWLISPTVSILGGMGLLNTILWVRYAMLKENRLRYVWRDRLV